MMFAPPRIIGGAWRGRKLAVPEGLDTRPTNARARQAAFDMLLHAPWAGHEFVQGAKVLDVFAGTGAFGLEALSRGAVVAGFIENARPALAALRENIASCKAEPQSLVHAVNALSPPPGSPYDLVFFDPPYGQNLLPSALSALYLRGWIAAEALIAAEIGPEDLAPPGISILAERVHGKARLIFWRHPG